MRIRNQLLKFEKNYLVIVMFNSKKTWIRIYSPDNFANGYMVVEGAGPRPGRVGPDAEAVRAGLWGL